MGPLNFRKDFWDYYSGQAENWPIANRRLPSNDPRNNRVFSHDVTAAILVSQNNEMAAMLVSQTNPLGVELFSYANALFCSNKFA